MKWKNIILLFLCIAGLLYTAEIQKNNKLPAADSQQSKESGNGGENRASSGTTRGEAGQLPTSAGNGTGDSGTESTVQDPQTAEGTDSDANTGGNSAAELEKVIRVLIKTQDFAGEYHPNLSLTCNSNTSTQDGQHSFQAGETIDLDGSSSLFDSAGTLKLVPEDESAGFTLNSIKREQGPPTYEGSLEIYRSGEGLLVINVLDLETYLKYVVPSEMPSTYEAEALKAQAVCARTYAWKQMQEGALADLHADVDDSVSFQVFNNISRQPSTDQAVDSTAGQVMTCDGQPITAYFFSTSSGSTSTNEVWSQEPEKYLQCVNSGDLESSEPWYRWNVTLSMDYLNSRIDKYGIGSLKGIMILKKSGGGAVDELKLIGSQGEKILDSEYMIRQVFSTEGIPVTRQDGTTTTEMSLMPSAYFTCTPVYENNQITGYYFEGGGYGHGVGMSQNGANHLASQGKSWQEILNYFYKEIDLSSIL
ncbi:MAG TPA: SpoIID/LytB domain-containing protein [Candidatus Pelethocola excrementipullorum]|nr:SpoIID/LytB domain-containing protein [Candidatus Pelethocola excrementipullorum]